jgi:hypothetical protein
MSLISHLLRQQGSNVMIAVVPQLSAPNQQRHSPQPDRKQAEVADSSRLHALGTAARVLRLTHSAQVRLWHCGKMKLDKCGATPDVAYMVYDTNVTCCRVAIGLSSWRAAVVCAWTVRTPAVQTTMTQRQWNSSSSFSAHTAGTQLQLIFLPKLSCQRRV